jgi:hypothetical protein
MINPEELGDPSLSIGPLRIWLHARQFEDQQDYWDANWLYITAYCSSPAAKVIATGPILHLGEVLCWRERLAALYQKLTGTAELPTIEPNLSVTISLKDGAGQLRIGITEDHLQETHTFSLDCDQSHLPALIRDLDRALIEFPIRGHT